MIPANDRLIVRVNMKQKDFMQIGDVVLKMANLYAVNYREKSPVIAEVVDGNDQIRTGQIICCHHNHYQQPSPYYLYDDLFSIPFNKTIFATFDSDGMLHPVCGNMLCRRVDIESKLQLPADQQKQYVDRYIVSDPGWTIYKPGQLIFTRPFSGYEIVYIWNNIEIRCVKVDSDMVCGVLR